MTLVAVSRLSRPRRCATRWRPGSTYSARTGSRRASPRRPRRRCALAADRSAPVRQGARALEVFNRSGGGLRRLALRLDRLVPEVRRTALSVLPGQRRSRSGEGRLRGRRLAPRRVLALPHLAVGGLMTVGRLAGEPEEARRTFVARDFGQVRRRRPGSARRSMGMTDDFELASRRGPRRRVGRALFGERHGRTGHQRPDRPSAGLIPRLVDSVVLFAHDAPWRAFRVLALPPASPSA